MIERSLSLGASFVFTSRCLTCAAGIGINISNKTPTVCLQDVLSTDAVACTVTKYVHWSS